MFPKKMIFILGLIFFSMTLYCESLELTIEYVREKIEKNEIGRGWRDLEELLRDANKGESPEVRKKNRQVIDSIIGKKPSLGSEKDNRVEEGRLTNFTDHEGSMIQNFDNNYKNRLNGKDQVLSLPDTSDLPRIEKVLERVDSHNRKKVAKINFDARYGKVIYEMFYPRKHLFKRNNSFMFDIASSVSRIRFFMMVGKKKYTFDYDGLENEWSRVLLPFKIFNSEADFDFKEIDSFGFEIDSAEWEENQLIGSVKLDDFRFMNLGLKDLEYQIGQINRNRFNQNKINIIQEMYSEREELV